MDIDGDICFLFQKEDEIKKDMQNNT